MLTDLLNDPTFLKLAEELKKHPNHPLNKKYELDKNKPLIKAGGILTGLHMTFPILLEALASTSEEDLTEEEWTGIFNKAQEIQGKFVEFSNLLKDGVGKHIPQEEREEIQAKVDAKYK